MMRTNCLLWAILNTKYCPEEGLFISKSSSGWFPHIRKIQFIDLGIKITEYVPKKRVRKWFPPLWFDGYVKTTYYIKG